MVIASTPRAAGAYPSIGPAAGADQGLKQSRGDAMKIYLLMLLISVIATLSHIDFGRKSPRREA